MVDQKNGTHKIKLSASEQRKQKSLANRLAKQEYYDIKKEIIEKEKDNYTRLAVIKTGDSWWKLFGHSAVIYSQQIAPRLRLKVNLRPDTDYDYHSDEGVVSLRSIEVFERNLASLKIYPRMKQGALRIYDLGYRVSAEDLNDMKQADELAWQKANKLITPTENYPSLRTELRQLIKMTYDNTRKMSEPARVMIGNEMMILVAKLVENFALMTYGKIDKRDYFSKTSEDLIALKAKMAIIEDLKLFDAMKVLRMAEQISRVQKRIADAQGTRRKLTGGF